MRGPWAGPDSQRPALFGPSGVGYVPPSGHDVAQSEGATLATIFIDPTARSGGNGSLFRPFNASSQVTFKPGDTYLQRAGTSTTATVNFTAQGSVAAPIVLGAWCPWHRHRRQQLHRRRQHGEQ